MGCVNCKPACSQSVESRSGVKKSTKKKDKKVLRAFLRALSFGRKKNDVKEAPSALEDVSSNNCPLNDIPKEANVSLRTDEDDSNIQTVPVVNIDHENIHQVKSQSPNASTENCHVISADSKAELRKERYRFCAHVELKFLSEIEAELMITNKRRDKCVNKLQLLAALKTCALQYPNYRAERFSELHVAIERLTECECHYVKKLYELKGMRAVSEAKANRYISKLTSGVKYTDIYSHRNSLYLSPIPEESE